MKKPLKCSRSAGKLADLRETPYEPTPYERAAMVADAARKKEKPLAPRMKVSEKADVTQIAPDHPDAAVAQVLLMEAIGAKDPEFLGGLLKQLFNAGTLGRTADEHGLNFMLSVVTGIEPKDQVEAMLAAQMAAVHMSTMTFARRLAHVDNIPQQDSSERAFNKLARTYVLKRYRTGGEQTVRVEHHVHDEIICEVPIGVGAIDEFRDLLLAVPDWAPGLPMNTKVRNGERFCKSNHTTDVPPPQEDVPPWEDNGGDDNASSNSAKTSSNGEDKESSGSSYSSFSSYPAGEMHIGRVVDEYIYHLPDGTPYLKVQRRHCADGK